MRVRTGLASESGDWDMGFHDHDDYELSAVFHGTGMFQCQGSTTSLSPGSLVLIPPNVPHRYWATTPIRFGIIQAGPLSQRLVDEFYRLTQCREPNVLRLSRHDIELYESMFHNWLNVASRVDGDNSTMLEAWLQLFFVFLAEQSKSRDVPITIEDAAEYIRSHLSGELRMADLATRLGMAESTFRRLFKTYYQMSPKQYQQKCRLEEAKWLLRSTKASMLQIAETIGFASLHTFSAWFQSVEGTAPTVWRKLQQSGAVSPSA
ncbi:AraC family transcriptional regulator [Alicyclobacillus fastidiosus]|uniref:AraC family transcriptional regulator n=1 Tax=Alicyclobacillus fastidiosus TaxID=392011 RepID=A0ABV5AEE9_9BACL|nr:AraC family transcriptional regulator [Alicyclobacillus fastidiosus]WEH11939.1 AraC family transcriptional regulator [Alicyclobacillus fastidiosus]